MSHKDDPLPYEFDETAWLDRMAELAADGRAVELDLPRLAEFLAGSAGRDRREVESRMVVLMTHLLKWEHQPERRSRSWVATIVEQRQELRRLASRGVLRNHAIEVLETVHAEAAERAAAETGMPESSFLPVHPLSLDDLLNVEVRLD